MILNLKCRDAPENPVARLVFLYGLAWQLAHQRNHHQRVKRLGHSPKPSGICYLRPGFSSTSPGSNRCRWCILPPPINLRWRSCSRFPISNRLYVRYENPGLKQEFTQPASEPEPGQPYKNRNFFALINFQSGGQPHRQQ